MYKFGLLKAAIASLFAVIAARAQDTTDPLANSHVLNSGSGSPSIVLISGPQTGDSCFQRIYNFNAPGNSLSAGVFYGSSGPMKIGATRETGLGTGDFDGDGFDEIAAVWEGTDRKLKLMVSRMQVMLPGWPETFAYIDSIGAGTCHEDPLNAIGATTDPWAVHLVTGNFDDDPEKEILLSYWSPSGRIVMNIYNVTTDTMTAKLHLEVGAADSSEVLDAGLGESARFDITTGNFDGDSLSEIALLSVRKITSDIWTPYLRLFEVTAGGIAPRALVDSIYVMSNAGRDPNLGEGIHWENLDITTGSLTNDGYDEIIVSVQVRYGLWWYVERFWTKYWGFDQTIEIYLRSYVVRDISSQIDLYDDRGWTSGYYNIVKEQGYAYYTRTPGGHSSVATGDLNLDGKDEVIWSREGAGGIVIFEPTYFNQIGSLPIAVDHGSTSEICVANLDTVGTPGGDLPEIVIVDRLDGGRLRVFRDSLAGTALIIREATKMQTLEFLKTVNMAIGNFNGKRITLGTPKYSTLTQILQPLVILNSPPVHFDVFNDTAFDVCKSFNANTSGFVAKYTKDSATSSEVAFETNKDWGISAGIQVEYSSLFWSLKGKLGMNYGEKFSKEEGSSHSQSVTSGTLTRVEDVIYASTMRYRIWEYPVFRDGLKKGTIMVVDPAVTENQWFPSKSWSGNSYVPDHEVGNILSYREYPALSDNPFLSEMIMGTYDKSFTVSGDPEYDWGLTISDFQTEGAETQKEFGVDWGVSGEYWGCAGVGVYTIQAQVEGQFSKSEIQTQRMKVSTGLNISVHLAPLDKSMAEVEYSVTPYAYWGKNGALVIDYAVRPEIAEGGGVPTWWEKRYGSKPDPAFILPWRYDPEKGYGIGEEAQRYQTKDLLFFPPSPDGGDTVTIIARVHNFSLVPTTGAVCVRFYIGDPGSGGTLIQALDGSDQVWTDSAIAARGTQNVRFQWRLPASVGQHPHIYAQIDPQNSIDEIHENNNTGWAVLNKETPGSDDVTDRPALPMDFALWQNYPNPFNPVTTIRYALPARSTVILKVYNVLGQEIMEPVNEQKPPGVYAFHWNAGNLPSGVYFCRLKATSLSDPSKGINQVKKMLLMK